MLETLKQVGVVVAAILIALYAAYTIGLSLVLRRLGRAGWKAFVPGYNYYVLITALGLPGRWMLYSLVPYLGTAYALAVAYRLGRVFHRGFRFSSFWLTFGAPVGIFVIARDSRTPDLEPTRHSPSLRVPRLRSDSARPPGRNTR